MLFHVLRRKWKFFIFFSIGLLCLINFYNAAKPKIKKRKELRKANTPLSRYKKAKI